MRLMLAARLLLLFLALTILLLAGAQNSSISDVAQLGPVQMNSDSVYQPEAPSIRYRNAGENLVPIRLNIPAIGVNAYVESLGLNGDLATPARDPWVDVGWYDLGRTLAIMGARSSMDTLTAQGAIPRFSGDCVISR
jgi:hypothetical protein